MVTRSKQNPKEVNARICSKVIHSAGNIKVRFKRKDVCEIGNNNYEDNNVSLLLLIL